MDHFAGYLLGEQNCQPWLATSTVQGISRVALVGFYATRWRRSPPMHYPVTRLDRLIWLN